MLGLLYRVDLLSELLSPLLGEVFLPTSLEKDHLASPDAAHPRVEWFLAVVLVRSFVSTYSPLQNTCSEEMVFLPCISSTHDMV